GQPQPGLHRPLGEPLQQQAALGRQQDPALRRAEPGRGAGLTAGCGGRHGPDSMRPTPLPALQDNYVWTLGGPRALVVDPGSATPVFEAAQRGLVPGAILLTHHHADHCAGVAELLERWPGLPVIAPDDPRIAFATERAGHG